MGKHEWTELILENGKSAFICCKDPDLTSEKLSFSIERALIEKGWWSPEFDNINGSIHLYDRTEYNEITLLNMGMVVGMK